MGEARNVNDDSWCPGNIVTRIGRWVQYWYCHCKWHIMCNTRHYNSSHPWYCATLRTFAFWEGHCKFPWRNFMETGATLQARNIWQKQQLLYQAIVTELLMQWHRLLFGVSLLIDSSQQHGPVQRQNVIYLKQLSRYQIKLPGRADLSIQQAQCAVFTRANTQITLIC